FSPHVIHLGANEDVVKFVVNPRLASRITPELRVRLDSLERAMREGTFTPPRIEFVDTAATAAAAAAASTPVAPAPR
ncbi:MAG TPA: hypothetical protein VFS05_08240, partial [Gemmatimonadaceae bacterium]|nr:hypothetical protein [Gemmatimonadaceae bacterium]